MYCIFISSELKFLCAPSSKGVMLRGVDEGVQAMSLGELAEIKVL
jgi:hypothetical protein